MPKRNPNIAKLPGGYLFPEIAKRKNAFQAENPDAKIISLGIGDTPGPLPPAITKGLTDAAAGMGTKAGYSGYPGHGIDELRELINQRFYNNQFSLDEIMISDGAKCDCGRLQVLFGAETKIAVQDPAYPVYVDTAVMMGQTGNYNQQRENFDSIIYLPCNPENNFFPDLSPAKDADLIFFCSPNNPTGATATKEQLQELVDFAKANGSLILFDAAYSTYIQDDSLPTTIFEIPGAKDVALEMNSFSKFASFTGVRLGWTIVPKELKFSGGEPVLNDWKRVVNTFYNGNSHIVQVGGIDVLKEAGWKESQEMVALFLENAKLIKSTLQSKGIETYAGENAPYIWARIPGKKSWEAFDYILENAHIVCTPGAGFGASGEGFVRFSAFGDRKDIEEATARLEKCL